MEKTGQNVLGCDVTGLRASQDERLKSGANCLLDARCTGCTAPRVDADFRVSARAIFRLLVAARSARPFHNQTLWFFLIYFSSIHETIIIT